MRKRLNMLIVVISFGLPFHGNSQVKRLSLKEALTIAAENNLSVKSVKAGEQAAKNAYRMTNALFLPGVSVSYTGMSANDPLSVFGYKLKQERVSQSDFDPSILNHPDAYENFNTRIEFQQPLLNMDGIYARKAAKNYYDSQTLQTKYTGQNIRYEVKKAYYRLELATMSADVLRQSVAAAEEALKLARQNELQGLAKKADVLEASVRLEERRDQLRETIDQHQIANEYLAHLLGLDLSTRIEPVDSLVQDLPQQDLTGISLNIKTRSDLLAWQKQIEANENMVQSERMKFIPRINAFGSYEWNDHKIAGSPVSSYQIGASLRWDLFSGFKNIGSIRQASARLEESRFQFQYYLSQSEIRINNAKRRAVLTYRQVRSKELAREQAAESLRIRINRFREGLEKTSDLLLSEALASQKKLEYIRSVYDYREAIFELEFLLEKEISDP